MNRREAIVGAVCGVLGTTVGTVNGGEVKEKDFVKILTNTRSATKFIKPVAEDDLQKILHIGVNAPSALNLQPWYFVAVTDRKLLAEIDREAGVLPGGRISLTESPTVVFVCCDDGDYSQYDAGVACDRMAVTAILMGYGAKTVATPRHAVNEIFKDKLGIPEKYECVTMLLLGVEETPSVDGVSGATSRVPFEEKVARIK